MTPGALRAHLAARAFGVGAADRVGVEVELTPLATDRGRFDLAASRARADRLWADLGGSAGAGGGDPRWCGGSLSREPGGQVEWSTPPLETPEAAARATAAGVRRLRARARLHDLDLIAVGLHPWATAGAIGLRTPKPRYWAMQRRFDRIGPYGRRMMRQTGSVQVSVDFGPPGEAAERWELAQRLAPVLAAMLANSAVARGRPSPWSSLRGEAWLKLDPSRTGIPARFAADPAGDPVDQYLAFALDAAVMFVVRPDGSHEVPDGSPSFRAWMAEGLPAGYPDLGDWQVHLSTLFPDIRPRGYLELRTADAPGVAWLGVPVLVAAVALREPVARRSLLDRLRPHHAELADLRERAARRGLADPTLRGLAEDAILAARTSLRGPDEALVGAFAERYVQEGRTPGDDARDRARTGGSLDAEGWLDLERERSIAASPGRATSPTLR